MARRNEREEKLLADLREMVDDATEALHELHTTWDEYLEFYQGVQDSELGLGRVRGGYTDWCPVNIIFSTTETKVPLLSDSVPMWYVVSPDAEHEAEATVLTQALQAVWYGRNLELQYQMMLRDQQLLGTGFMKAWWNPTIGPLVYTDEGPERAGDVDVSWVDPFSVRPEPGARSIEECEYLVLTTDVTKRRAERLWQKFNEEQAERVEGQLDGSDQSVWRRALAWLAGGFTRNAITKQVDLFRIYEVYHEGGERLTIFSGQNLLYDGENPTPNSQYPVVAFPNYPRGYSLFGMADTPHIKHLQTQLNRLTFRIAHNARLTAFPMMQVPPGVEVKAYEPGEVVRVPPGVGDIRMLPAGQMPPYMLQFREGLKADIDIVTGVHDVTRGLRPGSIQSGIGIQQLQEAANTRLRNVATINGRAMEKLGQLVFEFQQAQYTEERLLTYMEGSELRRVEIQPEMFRQQMYGIGGEEGEEATDEDLRMLAETEETEEPVEMLVDYRVVVPRVGELPMNASARAELALRVAQVQFPDGPAIDRQALLEALKFPNTADVLMRIEQRNAAMVQGQMAAIQDQQMAAGAGMAPPEGAPEEAAAAEQMGELLALLQQSLTPEELQVLDGILQRAAEGIQPTQDERGWIASLPEDVQQIIAQLVMLYVQAAGGVGAEPVAPTM